MNKLILSLLLLGALPVARGQSLDNMKFLRVYALAGGEYWHAKWTSWDKFAESYNEGWHNVATTKLSSFDSYQGLIYGLGVRMYVFGVEYSRYRFPNQTQQIVFKNGDKQQFELRNRGYNMNFPIVLPVSKYVWVGVDMGVVSLNGELHSRTVYKDGTVSYGPEQPFNGVFEFNKRWLVNVGPRIEFGNRVRGFLSATWNFMDPGDVTGLKDLGSDYGGVWTGQLRTVYLPEDFNSRKSEYNYYVGFDPMTRVMKGTRVQFGLCVDLYSK